MEEARNKYRIFIGIPYETPGRGWMSLYHTYIHSMDP
jgi:hypothetical protein